MLIDLFGFNWQPYLIPDTGVTDGDDGTVDDDLDEIDPDELKALLEDDDTEDDEESVEEKKTEEPSEPDSKLFSQEDIDRIIGERLARERRIQEERTMQEAEAKRQQQEKDRWWGNRQQEQIDRKSVV